MVEIARTIFAEIHATGLIPDRAARKYAQLAEAWYKTRATQLSVTPSVLFEALPIQHLFDADGPLEPAFFQGIATDLFSFADQREAAAVPQQELEGRPSAETAAQTAPDAAATPAEDEFLDEAPAEIQDFGEKIDGAKKDLWKEYTALLRAHFPGDVTEIVLSKHFPEPNYKKCLEEGVDPNVLAVIKAMRDEIPAKPRMAYKLTRWANEVKLARELANDLITGKTETSDLEVVMNHAKGMGRWGSRMKLYRALGYPAFLKASSWEIASASFSVFKGERFSPPKTMESVSYDGRLKQAFENYADAVAYVRSQIGDENKPAPRKEAKLEIYRYTKTGEICIGYKVAAGKYIDLKKGFKTSRDAAEYLLANRPQLLELLEKLRIIRPERRSVNDPRVGDDYRRGGNVAPDLFQSTFGFRGVQFGNYVEQALRPVFLNNAYDALRDLAAVTDKPPAALALNGELGLAFGARGSGGKNAPAAHYEPGQVAINLTKTNGAGSLAHEWFHALDNYFSRHGGAAMGYQTSKPTGAHRPEVSEAFTALVQAIGKSAFAIRSRELDKTRTKDYWSTIIELCARAFEAYVVGKLAAKGAKNDYLANFISEEAHLALDTLTGTTQPYPYPSSAEMPPIVAAFDHLFKTLQVEPGPKARLYQDVKAAYEPATFTAYLFEGADATSLIHEAAHHFLHLDTTLAALPNAPEAIRTDVDTTLKWFGVKGDTELERLCAWHTMTAEEQRTHHEKFAGAFERYMMEGVSPTPSLRSVFAAAKAWMKEVYSTLAGLEQSRPGADLLSDEMRSVMDRMFEAPVRRVTRAAASPHIFTARPA